MIKLTVKEDLRELNDRKSIHPFIKRYLQEYFYWLLHEYDLRDLKEVGQLCLLQQGETIEDLKLPNQLNEFCERLILQGNGEQITLLHVCFVFSNSDAISVFVEEKFVSDHTKLLWMGEYIGQKIIYQEELQ